ncbi:uncharacterized protein Z519_07670 [Cladophialophora bantiana CBS 173.52]|uniref:Ig-like domain-containing protein n=1 Tax=Cladophialophora bantiana (strain ATCC 10958 / CBS 173.52 / CDC B-1940 / NIH 8579) TaxID=1442370 RepID=A0A0D2FZ12_CLAB1|nr:uncharacterized protein Z519_07670 [Cladophialophora bantiana CBS 173.52]KIW91702.1 hypothetical protein Z519_07670 [Cladophialophora bantiana CBS 173.52]
MASFLGAAIIAILAIAPSTANAASTATSGSYTLCQFYSSIPGASSVDSTSMTLPLCPSSLLTFSYTIPSTTTTAQTAVPTSTPSISSLTLCQFYSSISGFPSPTEPVSSMTLPSCPSSLQDITYSYQAPLATSNVPATTTSTTPLTAAHATTAAVSSFTGAAASRPGLDRMLLGGAGGILVGAIGIML